MIIEIYICLFLYYRKIQGERGTMIKDGLLLYAYYLVYYS